MKLKRLIELLESVSVAEDAEVQVATPDDSGYFEDCFDIHAVCIFENGNVQLCCYGLDKE